MTGVCVGWTKYFPQNRLPLQSPSSVQAFYWNIALRLYSPMPRDIRLQILFIYLFSPQNVNIEETVGCKLLIDGLVNA